MRWLSGSQALLDDPWVLPEVPVPSYLALYRSGELERRVERAVEMLRDCTVCPRDCHVNRLENKRAVCLTGRYAKVASHFPHFGEEDCLRGWKGSGTIFFSYCNLRCVFCQNYETSQEGEGREARPEALAGMMLELQHQGCHNINFVTPEHVVPQILEGLFLAAKGGLRLSLVYNTGAYDSLDSIALMDGIMDIYMPDLKFSVAGVAKHLVKAKDYVERAQAAIKAMHAQVGPLRFDRHGLAQRGVLVRHLVMPDGLAGTREVMRFLAREVSPDTYVNIMGQYHPAGKVDGTHYAEINRRVTPVEVEAAYRIAREEGLHRFDERRPLVMASAGIN